MPSLGEISVTFVARTRKFSAAINGVTQRLNSLSKAAFKATKALGALRAISGISKDWTDMSAAVGRSLGEVQSKVGDTFKVVATETREGVKKTLVAVGGMRKGFDTSLRGTIKHLLSFKEFFGKIIHYITFTIGVQLVMGTVRAFKAMIETFKEFERAATDAAAISGYLGGAFESVREQIMAVSKELSKRTVYGILDVSSAYYDLASAGYDVSKLTARDLLPILNYAAATQSDLKEATYAVMASLKQFNLDLTDATHVVDVFTKAITTSFLTMERLKEGMKYAGPIAGTLGVSLEETTAALAILVDRGLEGSQAGQRLNMILTKLIKPSDEARRMLESMGISMDELNPKTHSLVEILYRLQAAGFDAASAATMFRARTAASAAVLVENADAVAQFTTSLQASQGITQNLAEKQMNTLWGRTQQMVHAFQELGSEIMTLLLPIFNKLISGISIVINAGKSFVDWIKGITSKISPLVPLLKIFIGALAGLAIALLALKVKILLVTVATWAWNAALAANPIFLVVMAIAGLITAIALLLEHFGLLDKVVNAAGQVLKWLADKVLAAISWLINNIIKSVKAMVDAFFWILDTLGTIIPGFKAIAEGLRGIGKSIGDFFAGLALQDRINELKDVAAEAYVYGLAVRQLSSEYRKLEDAISAYEEALSKLNDVESNELATAEERLNAAREATKRYEELQSQLSEFNQAQMVVVRTGGALIEAIRARNEELDKALGAQSKIIDLEHKQIKLSDDLREKREALAEAERAAAEAIARYGYDSEEAKIKLNDLVNAQDELNRILEEASKAEEELAKARSEVDENTRNLSETDMKLFNMASKVIELRAELTESLAEESKWKAKLAAFDILLKDTTKFYSEQLKKLRETTKKLYQEELKRYKLLYEYEDELKNLVDSLFEEGIVTQDVKKGYIDLMKAIGGVEKLTYKYVNVFSSLTESQKEAVIQFIKTGEMTSEFMSISDDARAVIIDYYNAMNKVRESANNLETSLLPLIQALYEQGIISSDTLKLFQDYISNAQDLADVNQTIADITGDLATNADEYVKLTARLARALQDQADETLTHGETINELINQLGLAGKIAARDLPRFLGKSGKSLDELTEAEIVAAIMIADLADSMGLLSEESTAQSLALDILHEDFSNLVYSMENALEATDTYWEVQNNLTKATENVKNAINALFQAFQYSTAELLANIAPSWERYFLLLDDHKDITQEITQYLNGQEWTEDYMLSIVDLWNQLNEAAGKDLEKYISIIISKKGEATWPDVLPEKTIGEADWISKFEEIVGRDIGEIPVPIGRRLAENMAVALKQALEGIAEDEARRIVEGWTDVFLKEYLQSILEIPEELFAPIAQPTPPKPTTPPPKPPKAEPRVPKETIQSVSGPFKTDDKWAVEVSSQTKKKILTYPTETLAEFAVKSYKARIGNPWPWAIGGIAGIRGMVEAMKSIIVKSPQLALIGEAGPEAVIPLSGINRKYGRQLLEYIIPRYFPDLGMQEGGIVGGTTVLETPTGTNIEEYRIMGPIIIEHVTDVKDFTEQLKFRARAAAARKL